MRVIACYSIKGGVGKTASAVNLAYWASNLGVRTLLIDLDPQGASSFYFRVKPTRKKWGKRFFGAYKDLLQHVKASDFDRLDIIPAHLAFRKFDAQLAGLAKRKGRLRKILQGMKKEYELVVLDCPPSIGYLAESVFTAANLVLVPVIPTTLSARTYDQLMQFFRKHEYPRRKIVPFFSMVQAQKTLHRRTMETMRNRYDSFLTTSIPFSTDVENMGEHRAPLDVYARNRPANKAFRSLWEEMAPLVARA